MTALAEEFDRGKLTHVHEPWTHRMATDLRENQTAYLLLLPSVLVFALLVVFPLLSTIWGAFNSTDAVGRFTGFAGLANFQALIEDQYMLGIVLQTLVFVFGTVALTVLLSFPLALILNQKFPGVVLAKALILLPWAAPLAIMAMTWRWIFNDQLGALNYLLHLFNITDVNILWLNNPNARLRRGDVRGGLVLDPFHDDHLPGRVTVDPAPHLRRGQDGRRQRLVRAVGHDDPADEAGLHHRRPAVGDLGVPILHRDLDDDPGQPVLPHRHLGDVSVQAGVSRT